MNKLLWLNIINHVNWWKCRRQVPVFFGHFQPIDIIVPEQVDLKALWGRIAARLFIPPGHIKPVGKEPDDLVKAP